MISVTCDGPAGGGGHVSSVCYHSSVGQCVTVPPSVLHALCVCYCTTALLAPSSMLPVRPLATDWTGQAAAATGRGRPQSNTGSFPAASKEPS